VYQDVPFLVTHLVGVGINALATTAPSSSPPACGWRTRGCGSGPSR
jgi:hypothetical protein